MALDNAQFMSELSITDPPGTDPLSEGDDQIRTSKRTQQQSFPNVDAAVTLSTAELNNAALQAQTNIFTVQQTFQQDLIRTVQGSNESGFYFCNDETTFRRWAFGRENTDTSGDWVVQRRDAAGAVQDTPFRVGASNGRTFFTGLAEFVQEVRVGDGSAAFPSFTFGSDPTMGMYTTASDVLSWGTVGTQQMNLTAAAFQVLVTLLAQGQVNFPNLPFEVTGVSGDLYQKQSQNFAPQELLLAVTP